MIQPAMVIPTHDTPRKLPIQLKEHSNSLNFLCFQALLQQLGGWVGCSVYRFAYCGLKPVHFFNLYKKKTSGVPQTQRIHDILCFREQSRFQKRVLGPFPLVPQIVPPRTNSRNLGFRSEMVPKDFESWIRSGCDIFMDLGVYTRCWLPKSQTRTAGTRGNDLMVRGGTISRT